MADNATTPDIAKLSFEDALKELEDIVKTLESGKGKLDEAIRSYERGAALQASIASASSPRRRAASRRSRWAPTARSRPSLPRSADRARVTSRLHQVLAEDAAAIEAALATLLPERDGLDARLFEAMRYAALGGGKRLRPFLVLQSARLFGVSEACALRVAAAVEMVHCYSLVHDDLPAMDDDDLRRGRPTVHKQFDEATAILAGDGLLTLAFEVLADPRHAWRSAGALRAGAGARAAPPAPQGMVGGQMIDLAAEKQALDIGAITRLQRLKTGALIALPARPAPSSARRRPQLRSALRGYAQELGLAFQIADDLLDVEGSAGEIGKRGRQGRRARQGDLRLAPGRRAGPRPGRACWPTRPSAHLDLFGEKADLLRDLARWSSIAAADVDRRHQGRHVDIGHNSSRDAAARYGSPIPADLRALSPERARAARRRAARARRSTRCPSPAAISAPGSASIELTVALHHVFDTPRDRLIWDVGHQAYPHKILTGRRDRIRTLRQGGGLSGFTRRVESEYDPFGAAHSSTSISAGLGMAVARDLKGAQQQRHRRHRRRRHERRHGL